ncbi:glycosyltransferase family 4 protein [Burkholderiaceae bacterium UC74_6]
MVRVAQISFHHDLEERRPTELLADWYTLSQLAQAAREGGAEVRVFQASRHLERHVHEGISFSFGPFDGAGLRAAVADADVLHVQGLGFARDVLRLAAVAQGRPILLQDRANRPPAPWRRSLWRAALGETRGLLFCSREQSLPFQQRGLIGPGTRIYELPGVSSDFEPRDIAQARALTGIHGQPALLWVAHLDANKDPLTVLDALALASPQLPDAQLWCCFAQAPLLDAVKARIASDPRLTGRVHLLGRQPHERIGWLMSAADLLVQGSHREANGCSLVEALSCGLPPLVPDIPSFRALLSETEWPALWPVGDASALAGALLATTRLAQPDLRKAARARFDDALSTAAMGRRLVGIYRDVLSS